MKPTVSPRAVLFGWDGATFSVLDALVAGGTMPFLGSFLSQGARGVLRSTPHPISPAAWVSMMTGRSPGNHGIFDFVKLNLEGEHPSYTLATSNDIEADTIWAMVSRAGYRVTCLNFPCMFPPPAVNGFVVPGYVPWSYLSRAVHPPGLLNRLKEGLHLKRQELGTDWALERKALQGLCEDELEGWVELHIAREQEWFAVVEYLMTEEPCELTALVMDGVDRLHHLCYQLLDPNLPGEPASPAARQVRELCLRYFRQLDGYLQKIVSLAGPEASVFVMSDHGGQLAGEQIFYANVWLEQQKHLVWAEDALADRDGHLALDDHREATVLFDWSKTTAFALTSSSNGIYIRQATAPGDVGIDPADYRSFRDQMKDDLLATSDPRTGRPIMENVLTRDEAFPGAAVGQAPDLTLVLRDPGFLSILRADAPLKPRPAPCGTHHPEGIFLARGPAIRRGVDLPPASIMSIAPTLLYSLGLPIPTDLEAPPLLSAFDESFVAAHPIQTAPQASPNGALAAPAVPGALSPEANEEVVARLRALGYLE